MTNPSWLEQVRAALEKEGLPRPYIERLVGELRDHGDDLRRETAAGEPAAIEGRLGPPAVVAAQAAAAYRICPLPVSVARRRILTTDMVAGVVFCIVLSAAMLAYSAYTGETTAVLGVVVFPLLLIPGLRRFLRSIECDPRRGLLIARSILPWHTYTLPFASVRAIRSVTRTGGYNVAVSRVGSLRPLLFEVWTAEEDSAMRSFLDFLSLHGLAVERRSA